MRIVSCKLQTCFRIEHLEANITPNVGTEDILITECRTRILAEDIIAIVNVPPHDNSAVDGYAIRFADLSSDTPTQLPVGQRIAAGQFLNRPLKAFEAIRIFTGAPMPTGADTVMMQEDCTEADSHVGLLPGIKKGANRRHAGEDMKSGETVLLAGQEFLHHWRQAGNPFPRKGR